MDRNFLVGLIKEALGKGASDIHLTAGLPPVFRVNGELEFQGEVRLTSEDTRSLAEIMLPGMDVLESEREVDFAYQEPGVGRFRVNLFYRQGSVAAAMRVIKDNILSLEKLGLPPAVASLAERRQGLVLVTGPTGSGKSTTLAAMIDLINKNRSCHIITLEDPVEFIHRPIKSVINQREIGSDSKSFARALRAALRQDPDVILVGEMRDLETISTAITAAETGHLVLATLHTGSAAQTIDRIIDVFPPHQQAQVKVQLADTLQGIVTQQLVPRADGSGRVPAVELLIATPAVKNLIREGKTHQILSVIQTGGKYGMQTMEASLRQLYQAGLISSSEMEQRGTDTL